MKRKIYIVAAACLCIMSLASCEDWLEEEVRSSKTEDTFPLSQADLEGQVTSLYRTGAPSELTGAGSAYIGPVSTLPGMLTGYFSNEYEGQERTCAYTRNLTRQENTNTVSESLNGLYENCYKAIRISNTVIQAAPGISGIQEETKENLVAQAKFFRAFNYFTLVKYFGGVPLKTEPYGDASENLQLKQSTEAEVYAVIEKDLKDAVAVLPATKFYDNGLKIGKYVASMLLTSVYMQEGKYAEAAEAVRPVLTSGHKLTENGDNGLNSAYNQLRTTEGLDEVIYAYEYNASISTSGWWPSYAFNASADGMFDTYSIFRSVYGPQTRYLNIYDANDLRVQPNQFFHWKYEYVNKKGEHKTWQSSTPGCWYWLDKTAVESTGQGTKDVNFFRYSEALLDAAEAIVQSGNTVTAEAAGYLAQVQARALGKTVAELTISLQSLSKDEFIKTCWTERLREFPLEFKIWDDCLRTKKFPVIPEDAANRGFVEYVDLIGAQNGSGATFKESDLLWPFPLTELQRNKDLVQNSGYSEH